MTEWRDGPSRHRTIDAGVLRVAYDESGPETGEPVILLHGFPYSVRAYDEVVALLSAEGRRCIVPSLRGYGDTRFLSAQKPRSGEQAALGADLLALMDALGIERAILGGYDWGGRAACIVAALWPGRVRGLVSCGTGYNIQNIAASRAPADPATEHRFWYQYYFHSERGRAGLAAHRRELCRLLWRLWSPSWAFDEKTFADSAAAFDNPDFVDVVIHSYRHRFGLVAGDPDLLAIESLLATQPSISVPTIVMAGSADGVEGPIDDVDTAEPHFTGPYEHRVVKGVGHNLPQEAPHAFANAVLSSMTRSTVVPPTSSGYDIIADRFDAERGTKPWERPFFERLASDLHPGARILDCGCGSGHLGVARLVEAGHAVTGLDGSAAMLSLFARRYPNVPVVLADMRTFDPRDAQDAVVAWDSFFHLSQPDQAAMIERFGRWLSPGGRLLFTSGPDDDGSVVGEMFGVPFSYASFDEAGYRERLSAAGFESIRSVFDEPRGTVHKVWTARKRP